MTISEHTLNLINAIQAGDALEMENAFNAAMAEKVAERLDNMRTEVAMNMFKESETVVEEFTQEEWDSLTEEEQAQYELLDEASKATDAGLQTRMDKNFTKSVATRYDGTRKQEAEGKKGLVKTAKIIKSRGGDAAAAKQKASDKNDYENEM